MQWGTDKVLSFKGFTWVKVILRYISNNNSVYISY
jgi:hypothetical protein